MTNNKNNGEEPTSGPGWAAFEPAPEDFDLDTWENLNSDHFLHNSFKDRMRRIAMGRIAEFWFKTIVKRFARSVYEISAGDFGWFIENQRYQPRARYLIKNKWTTVQFGIYLIEYTIADGIAYSYYSLNYGINYTIHMESELSKNHELNVKIIANLFKMTEEFLHHTISNRSAPHTPN